MMPLELTLIPKKKTFECTGMEILGILPIILILKPSPCSKAGFSPAFRLRRFIYIKLIPMGAGLGVVKADGALP